MPKIKLLSIEEEAAACRKAWEGYGVLSLAHCLHHQEHFEILGEPVEKRIQYILWNKPPSEQAWRLRWLRPVALPDTELQKAAEKMRKASAEVDPRKKCAEMKLLEAMRAWRQAWMERWMVYEKLGMSVHAKLFPGCPWDGHTIFAKGWDEGTDRSLKEHGDD